MKQILNIISEINPYITINENTDLIEEKVLDSAGFIFFISLLEERYSIDIPDDEIKPENFKNTKSIMDLIIKLK